MSTVSFDEFDGNPPASDEVIKEAEAGLSAKLPDDYLQFMRLHNGGEGSFGGDSYLMLWKVEELSVFNQEYEVADYCKDLILFGSNGGGEAYGFDTRDMYWKVVQVPFVGMAKSLFEELGASFTGFLERIAADGCKS